jgi:hypothetical protein
MAENKTKASNRASVGSYSRPTLVRYGTVTKLTASGTTPGGENAGSKIAERP